MQDFKRRSYPISIADQIPYGVIGAYILSRDGQSANYVGRSDRDLGSEIVKTANALNAGYTHFFFERTETPHEAYIQECKWFHSYSFVDNKEHPKPPEGRVARCPICTSTYV